MLYIVYQRSEAAIRCALKESGGEYLQKKYTQLYLTTSVLNSFIGNSNIFAHLTQYHCADQMAFENHVLLLMRAIINKYINIRLYSIGRSLIKDVILSERHAANKLVLFKGQ